VAVPPHIRSDIKHHLDTFVAQDSDALLLTGEAACGHLSPSTFRKAWHQVLKTAAANAFGCTTCGTMPG
jgi:hypothetical protein